MPKYIIKMAKIIKYMLKCIHLFLLTSFSISFKVNKLLIKAMINPTDSGNISALENSNPYLMPLYVSYSVPPIIIGMLSKKLKSAEGLLPALQIIPVASVVPLRLSPGRTAMP